MQHGERNIKLYDDGIELLYHNKTSKYWGSMDVYRIPIENINAVLYDSNFHILTIIGEGELLSYDDFSTKRINHQNSQRKFYNNSPYAFMTLFEKEEEIVTAIQNVARHKPQK